MNNRRIILFLLVIFFVAVLALVRDFFSVDVSIAKTKEADKKRALFEQRLYEMIEKTELKCMEVARQLREEYENTKETIRSHEETIRIAEDQKVKALEACEESRKGPTIRNKIINREEREAREEEYNGCRAIAEETYRMNIDMFKMALSVMKNKEAAILAKIQGMDFQKEECLQSLRDKFDIPSENIDIEMSVLEITDATCCSADFAHEM